MDLYLGSEEVCYNVFYFCQLASGGSTAFFLEICVYTIRKMKVNTFIYIITIPKVIQKNTTHPPICAVCALAPILGACRDVICNTSANAAPLNPGTSSHRANVIHNTGANATPLDPKE
jgi:hypothetical protein